MGSKSTVAAPLWADSYHRILNGIMQTTGMMSITQIPHQRGFDAHVYACHPRPGLIHNSFKEKPFRWGGLACTPSVM